MEASGGREGGSARGSSSGLLTPTPDVPASPGDQKRSQKATH